jgi:hypothetical protein
MPLWQHPTTLSVDVSLVCPVAAATMASLAGNETTAGFIMHAPGDSVAKTVLTLLEVGDQHPTH